MATQVLAASKTLLASYIKFGRYHRYGKAARSTAPMHTVYGTYKTEEDGSQVIRDTEASVTTKYAACSVYLCMRTLQGERISCWHTCHTQKQLQRVTASGQTMVFLNGSVREDGSLHGASKHNFREMTAQGPACKVYHSKERSFYKLKIFCARTEVRAPGT